jgi:polar amino acid transport system permease protein
VVQIFIVFFIFPEWGIQLEAFPAAVLALSILGTAFICEIVAGGIKAVDRGQWEAAASSGLTLVQQLRFVILPQALQTILPPLVGQYVLMVKDSSVVSVIGVVELTRVGWVTVVRIPEGLMVFSLVGLFYFVICYPMIRLSNTLERKFALGEMRL